MIEQEENFRDNPLFGMYVAYLSSFGVHVLRNVGREVGVSRPAAKNKDVLIQEISAILIGEIPPIERSKRGAPVKEDAPDPAIMQELSNIRLRYEKKERALEQAQTGFTVSTGNAKELFSFVGTLVFREGENRIEEDPTLKNSPYVSLSEEDIRRMNLRLGDLIACYAKKEGNGEASLDRLVTVCSLTVGAYEKRKHFEDIPPAYPDKLLFPYQEEICSVKIAKGQRALVCVNEKRDGYPFMKRISRQIEMASPATPVFAVLLDGRAEEVFACKDKLPGAIVFTAGAESTPEQKVFAVTLALERAKRIAEVGYDSVVFLDSLPSYAKALAMTEGNREGWALSPSPFVVSRVENAFACGKNLRGGGSLTLFAFVDQKNSWSEQLLSFLDGVENCKIFLQDGGEESKESRSYTLYAENIQ